MKIAWYDEIFKLIDKVFQVKIPFEIVHFPSTGVTSAINRYAEIVKGDPESTCACLIIDLRAAVFNHDNETNKKEFFRILVSHIEQYLDTKIDLETDQNVYHVIEDILRSYLRKKKKVLVVFFATTQINLSKCPEYRDLLIFLDRMRDTTNGAINVIIATTYPQFDDENPSPMPIITQYFNYYKKAGIYRSINEDILKVGKLKKHTNEQVEYLVEISGGLIVVIKGFMRDLIMADKSLSDIDSVKIDQKFFSDYPNCKQSIDRLFHQLKKEFIDVLIKINNGEDVSVLDEKAVTYLTKTSILDENNNIRGQIIPAYLKYAYKDAPEEVVKEILKKDIANDNDIEQYILSSKILVDRVSGEILINGIPQDDYLSEKELNILSLLYSKRGKDVGREEIAEILWGKKAEYSDWAIDKLVSRVRDKLGDDKPYRLIKTARGMGFILV